MEPLPFGGNGGGESIQSLSQESSKTPKVVEVQATIPTTETTGVPFVDPSSSQASPFPSKEEPSTQPSSTTAVASAEPSKRRRRKRVTTESEESPTRTSANNLDPMNQDAGSKESLADREVVTGSRANLPATDKEAPSPITPTAGTKRRRKPKPIVTEPVSHDNNRPKSSLIPENNATSPALLSGRSPADAANTEEDNSNPFRALGKVAEDFRGQILAMTIHRTDPLRFEATFISKPVVRVHILGILLCDRPDAEDISIESFVDAHTGKYLQKSNQERPVTSYYEQGRTSAILPVITKPYSLRKHHSPVPMWEETLVFNEDYLHIVQPGTLILLEVLDLKTVKHFTANFDGWERIAWAFMRPIGSRGEANTEKEVRLQLYEFPSRSPPGIVDNSIPYVYRCWKSPQSTRRQYPGTLHVHVGAQMPLEYQETSRRAYLPNEIETGKVTYDQLLQKSKSGSNIKLDANSGKAGGKASTPPWRRMYNQKCQIPNKQIFRIASGKSGCTTLAFSSGGFYLAAGCEGVDTSCVKIYDTMRGARICTLEGHEDTISEIIWSTDERYLMSALSDGTIRLYEVFEAKINAPVLVAIYQHPTPVHSIQFMSLNQEFFIVSASNDETIRIWAIPEHPEEEPERRSNSHLPSLGSHQPVFELKEHSVRVSAIVWDQAGSRMFSGDKSGVIKIWKCEQEAQEDAIGVSIKCLRTVHVDSDEAQHPITCLRLHHNGRYLFVRTRDAILCMLDLRLMSFTKDFALPPGSARKKEGVKSRVPLKAEFSPCGSFLFVPGHDGVLYIYQVDSQALMGSYSKSMSECPIVALTFHPYEHMLAYAAHGDSEPIQVYTWDMNAPPIERRDVVSGLSTMEQALERMVVNTGTAVAGSPLRSPTPTAFSERLAAVTRQVERETAVMMRSLPTKP